MGIYILQELHVTQQIQQIWFNLPCSYHGRTLLTFSSFPSAATSLSILFYCHEYFFFFLQYQRRPNENIFSNGSQRHTEGWVSLCVFEMV